MLTMSFYSLQHNPNTTVQPRFSGGVMDAMANVIGKVDNSHILQLVTTDFLGMGAPRTGIELVKRGSDAGRETFIRETLGLIGNLFFVGWFNYLMVKGLGKLVKTYNPKQLPLEHWINAEAAHTLGTMYGNILNQPNVSLEDARKQLIKQTLASLEATDRHTGTQAFSKLMQREKIALAPEVTQGRLTPKAVEKLTKLFASPQVSLDEALQVAKQAGISGLSDKVHLRDKTGTLLLKERDLKSTLAQLKHFLELVDRATGQLKDASTQIADKEQVAKNLFNTLKNPTFLDKLLPRAKEGLLPYIQKSKKLYTYVPILLAVGANISVAFLNNWWTKRKNGGKNFFPGEKAARRQQGGQMSSSNPAPPTLMPAIPAVSSLQRGGSIFNYFNQYQTTGGSPS